MNNGDIPVLSPKWSPTTKLIAGLTIVAAFGALLARFRNLIGPLLLVFVLTYLLHPVIEKISAWTRLSWRGAVNLIYIILIIILLGSFTASGFAIVTQLQGLVKILNNFINDLPQWIDSLSTQSFALGPFQFNIADYNLNLEVLAQQLLDVLRPVLGQAGGLLSAVAGQAIEFLGWSLFVLVVSYFILADERRVPDALRESILVAYNYDMRRLGREINRTWNAFLRGQIIIILIAMMASFVLMSILGVRYALAIAFLTGVARFIPILGPWTVDILIALVAFFQGSNYFGLPPLYYAIIAVAAAIVLDQIMDNVISPHILGETLGVHPAGVLIVAIIAANLIGFIGLLLAAPVLASLTVLGRYVARKMLDLEPWPEAERESPPISSLWAGGLKRVQAWLTCLKQLVPKKPTK